MKPTISAIATRSAFAMGLLSAASLMGGCVQIAGTLGEEVVDDIFDPYTPAGFDDALDARVGVAAELDPARVRVALFSRSTDAVVDLGDGEGELQGLRIDVSTDYDGRVRLGHQSVQAEDGTGREERFGGVAIIEPVHRLDVDTRDTDGALTLELPEDVRSPVVLVAWYDGNDNYKLELSQDGESEFARVFRSDSWSSESFGKEFMLLELSRDYSEDDPSAFYRLGYVVHDGGNGDRIEQELDQPWDGSAWAVDIDQASELPVE